MNILPVDKTIIDKFGPYTLSTGILLIVLGMAGILLPNVMSLSAAILVGWLLLIGGSLWAVHTYQSGSKNIMDWIKPVLLFGTGSLMLFYPLSGVATMGLLLAVYLLLDAMHSFALARAIYPAGGWGWIAFNGIVSALLAAMFLIGWPTTSLWLVGLFVGISLLFDGWALVTIGWALRRRK
jgi:membrane protein HdeD